MAHESCRACVPFSLHGNNLPEGHIRGMASVFNTLIDASIPTRILPGAFTKTLRENGHRVKVLYQHNELWPIGVPTRMEETREGLLVEARISATTQGNDVLTLIRDKVITELSIGFNPIVATMVDEGPGVGRVRHIKELRLFEFSPVSFAANKEARITNVNSEHRPSPELARALDMADRRYDAFRQSQLRDLDLSFSAATLGRGRS